MDIDSLANRNTMKESVSKRLRESNLEEHLQMDCLHVLNSLIDLSGSAYSSKIYSSLRKTMIGFEIDERIETALFVLQQYNFIKRTDEGYYKIIGDSSK